jgi:uncharacterized protein
VERVDADDLRRTFDRPGSGADTDDLHSEKRAGANDRTTDLAEAEHERRFSVHASERTSFPSLLFLSCERTQEIALECEEHRERVIAHFVRVDAARVRDDDLLRETTCGEEPVDTGAEEMNETELLRTAPIDLRRRAADEDLDLGEALFEIALPDEADLAAERLPNGVLGAMSIIVDACVEECGAPCHSDDRMYQDEEELARRGSLGLELRASTLEVLRVVPGSTSDVAGVMPGDVIATIDGEAIDDGAHLARVARSLRPGARVVYLVERGRVAHVLESIVVPAPIEEIAGADVKLGHVPSSDGYRLRTIATVPVEFAPPFTAVLMLPGLGLGSCELSADREDPRRKLIEAFTALGLVTIRVERSGTGDSEGPPAATTDLFTEIEGYRAALDALRAEEDVDSIVLFGHSVGGMIAPFLGGAPSGIAAIAVFGTSARKWSECIALGTRRQRLLAGVPDDEELDRYVASWADIHSRVLGGGLTPEEVFELSPSLRALESPACTGRTMFGRDVSYFQQLERLDLPSLWATTNVPVLVLAGLNDWVCGADDAEAIASCAPHARLVELEGIGHDMLHHEDLARSFHSPREGKWDGSIADAFAAWLARIRDVPV